MITLKELPVKLDADGLARGFMKLFTQDEIDILRFGMLPAEKMEVLEREMRESLSQHGTRLKDVFYLSTIAKEMSDDEMVSTVNGETVEWNLSKLVKEAVREVTLKLYEHGNLVV